ncbi:hypothetical protein CLU79DRAFT_763318 [Phycomyces nitens]|nr:hypothetical protein CLU79DRAFT_763318 [Phycomyces nitens]
MHRITARLTSRQKPNQRFAGMHTSAVRAAITRFNLPAMSPTMTEGVIHKWMKKEGESFTAGDVLIELETDKAQIDVEAQDDGVLAKIILKEGQKAPVNSLIGLLAEEGDDISNVQIPETKDAPAKAEESAPVPPPTAQAKQPEAPTKSMDHGAIDTKQLKKPLSPAVLSLVLKHHIEDLSAIKATGPGGRILKGDVLAHLGQIAFRPAPKFNNSAAPPRDQIVFAKPSSPAVKKEKIVLPNFIAKQIIVDELLSLRRTLNDQHNTSVSVNDFVSMAASRALQDVTKKAISQGSGVVHQTNPLAFQESYKGGEFKIHHLAPTVYDFISDTDEPSKPYVLSLSPSKRIDLGQPKKSSDDDMLDLIGFLGGESPASKARTVKLVTGESKINFGEQPSKYTYSVEFKLQGDKPGKILNDGKAAAFLDRVEYYVRHPTELVQ